MLISKLYFKMQYLLTITYKPEMARFYYSCMDRAYSYLMKLFTLNAIKRILLYRFRSVGPVLSISHRFAPGLITVSYPEIFVDLPFELSNRAMFGVA